MKQITFLLFTGLLLSLAPTTTQALSCMDPVGMKEMYTQDDRYRIFTGIAGPTEAFLSQPEEAPDLGFRSPLGESGYVAQDVEVTAVYKGEVAGSVTVNHQKNATWGYMCSSGPVNEGATALFIVSPSDVPVSGLTVVNTYPVDSQLASELISALGTPETPEPPTEISKAERRQQLALEIRELIVLIREKLAAWRALAE